MPYGHQIWWEEPLSECNAFARVKGLAGVSQGQPEVKLRRNDVWPPNFVGRTPDQSVTHCWGQRSCRRQPGSTRSEIPQKCPRWPPNLVQKDSRLECLALMGSKGLAGVSWGHLR